MEEIFNIEDDDNRNKECWEEMNDVILLVVCVVK